MKILILHQHFKIPEKGGAIRSYYLSRSLADSGMEVVVITAHNDPGYRRESYEGIDIHYLPVAYDNRFGFIRRITSFYRFMALAVREAAKHRDASLCYAISTPLTTGLAAKKIHKRYGIPFMFEVGDLWPDAPIQMGFIRQRPLQRYLYSMEAGIYRDAVSIVALSVAIREAIEQKCPGQRIDLIPNMSDTEFYKPGQKLERLEEKYRVKDKLVVSYIGAVGVANGLHHFIECAAECEKAGLPVHFQLCGDGAMLEWLKRYTAKLGLRNFSFIPFQNREGVNEVMNVTDATFISYQPFTILETGSPNKFFDGLAAGKMVIINFGGWVRKEIESSGCGIYVSPRSPSDFVSAIRPFLDDKNRLIQYQHASRALAEQKYSRRKLSDDFVSLIRRTVESHKT